MAAPDFEHAFAQRLVDLAADVAARGVPPDLVVRAILAAGLHFAQRYDSGARIAEQLQPVLDAMADDDQRLAGPGLQ